MAAPKELYRIIDANFNRSKEGLRVCEDMARFVWDDKNVSASLKSVRHDLNKAIEPLGLLKVLSFRDIQHDVGRGTTVSESKRTQINDVFWANSQRVKESLRVLEEVTKLLDSKTSQSIKNLRYKVYAIEQKAFKKR